MKQSQHILELNILVLAAAKYMKHQQLSTIVHIMQNGFVDKFGLTMAKQTRYSTFNTLIL